MNVTYSEQHLRRIERELLGVARGAVHQQSSLERIQTVVGLFRADASSQIRDIEWREEIDRLGQCLLDLQVGLSTKNTG